MANDPKTEAKAEWPKGDPKEMTLAEILYEVQQRLTVPKSLTNDYGKYQYRNLEQINRAVKKILADYPGVILRYHDEITIRDGWRYIVSTCSLERGTDKIFEQGFARESEHKSKFDDAQVTGSSSSYARKFAAQALFAIDGEDDPDEQNANKKALPTSNNRQGQQRPMQQRQAQPTPAPRPSYRGQQQNYAPAPWE